MNVSFIKQIKDLEREVLLKSVELDDDGDDFQFELDDFSHEHLLNDWESKEELWTYNYEYDNTSKDLLEITIYVLNQFRCLYLKTNYKRYWWQMIQLLPSSYNQRRTWTGNYENLFSMYHQRKNHKLDEWHQFCDWIETLPYANGISKSKLSVSFIVIYFLQM